MALLSSNVHIHGHDQDSHQDAVGGGGLSEEELNYEEHLSFFSINNEQSRIHKRALVQFVFNYISYPNYFFFPKINLGISLKKKNCRNSFNIFSELTLTITPRIKNTLRSPKFLQRSI